MTVEFTSQLKQLHDNTVQRYATLWRIQRTDGSRFRFTDHDTAIYFQGQYYSASLGFNVSATQRESGLNEQNKEAAGIIDDDSGSGITFKDLRAGRYRNAVVFEYLVDWEYPWLGPLYETKYSIADLKFDGFVWKADLVGQAKYLRMPVGKIYNRNCRHTLGMCHDIANSADELVHIEPHCQFDMAGNFTNDNTTLNPATITNTTVTMVNTTFPRKIFRVPIHIDYEPQDFKYGLVSLNPDGSDNAEFTTFIDMPFDVTVGDQVTLTAGCDKTLATCNGKFSNRLNFGGYPDIPNTDRAILIPDVMQ